MQIFKFFAKSTSKLACCIYVVLCYVTDKRTDRWKARDDTSENFGLIFATAAFLDADDVVDEVAYDG